MIGFLQLADQGRPDLRRQSIDRLLKLLWREDAKGEDIAYLLGRVSFGRRSRTPSCCASRDDRPSSGRSSGSSFGLRAGERETLRRVEGIAPPAMTPRSASTAGKS